MGFCCDFKKKHIIVQKAPLFNVNGNLISLSLTRSRWGRQGIEIGTEKVPGFEVAKNNYEIKMRWKIKAF